MVGVVNGYTAGWPDERIADLRLLWIAGYSTPEIGRRLGCTKNAVVGKVNRLADLVRRPSPIKRKGSIALPAPQPVHIVPRITLPPLSSSPTPIVARPACVAHPTPTPAPTPRPERHGARCQWVLEKGRMCDAPATAWRSNGTAAPEGAVWCPAHRAKVYQHRASSLPAGEFVLFPITTGATP